MKKFLALTLILSSGIAFADQCPATVNITNGHVDVPAGYTYSGKLDVSLNETVQFTQAGYNYYNHGEHHDGRVSCDYIDSSDNEMDLVTIQNHIPEPKENSSKNKWEPIFIGGDACNWENTLSPSDCLYNNK